MVSPALDKLNRANMKQDVPEISVGDTVRVHARIYEGDKQRVQVFTGTVIARDGGRSATATFTVRRISHGVGVERVFPFHSPHIVKIEVTGSAHVRRAKLYYLRNRTGKKARLQEKIRK
jgi:large subunit ribosomal protein L19